MSNTFTVLPTLHLFSQWGCEANCFQGAFNGQRAANPSENLSLNSPVASLCLTGLWGTTLTENTAEDRELYVKTTLRELLVYVIFLVDICLCE